MEVANSLAYYDMATITAEKSFIVQDLVLVTIFLLWSENFGKW
jgi:hypothetical protein